MERHPHPVLPSAPVDVAVVGGGLAGLVAAAFTARAGLRTVLIDAGGLGGRARTDVRAGVSMNLGPHALYVRGAGARVLTELGIEPAGGLPTASGPAFWRDRRGDLPTTAGAIATTRLLSTRSRLQFARVMGSLRSLDPDRYQHVSVTELVDDLVDGDDVRALVHGLVRLSTYVDAPDELSAGSALEQLRIASGGVRYLDHGWTTLVDALAASARVAGARVVTGVTVDGVAADEITGTSVVTTSIGDMAAATVVLAGLSPEAIERVVGAEQGALRHRAGPAARAACLDLVLDEPPPETFALDLDRALYYSVHSATADLTPDGLTLASLAHYRRLDEVGDRHRDRTTMEEFAARLGVGAARDSRYLHDMVVMNGIPLARHGGVAGRPAVDELAGARFGRPGVLLAGDWVGAEGLLADAAIASGSTAARAAVAAVSCREVAV